jgi:ribosomal protein S18 acetylase RimI-like enzyme
MDELARFFAFERRLLERLSTRMEPFEYGVAFFDEEYRERYSSNFLLADRLSATVSAGMLMDAADRMLGGVGFQHREVVVRDDRVGQRLAPAFADAGYEVERDVVMVQRRHPDRKSDLLIRDVAFTGIRPLLLEIYRRTPWAHTDEVVRKFTEHHGKNERVIGARFFVARIGEALAGVCELYVDGPDAQVENVDTLEEFRGRGIARAVVLRAVEAAREAGARHVFIVADEGDWPKELYERLGFDRIGRVWQFLRWPDDHR